MQGIVVDCKTGKQTTVDDGLPMPAYPPAPEPSGLDLQLAAKALLDIDQMKVDIADLQRQPSPR